MNKVNIKRFEAEYSWGLQAMYIEEFPDYRHSRLVFKKEMCEEDIETPMELATNKFVIEGKTIEELYNFLLEYFHEKDSALKVETNKQNSTKAPEQETPKPKGTVGKTSATRRPKQPKPKEQKQ